ncbi:hypothetical protein [Hymenobacter sp. PAMC 26628]|uniref:hypothetical protein n=1 Tax=Hymenobacter sp. PAMC 26628 TaxID=1484118 RepID=UPI000770684B|nr:hypothetical protein [Hymenobacter sp. PAMC 26628]AMJ66357.1 hypothetical protein AXW84_13640 [Hymenobacter sp. PAMC 26628]
MKRFLCLLLLLPLPSYAPRPEQKFKECPCTHTDLQKRLYNQILTELIEHHFYNYYLPESESETIIKGVVAQVGIAKLDRLAAHYQNQQFNHKSRFKTIYLDTISRKSFAGSIGLEVNPDAMNGLSVTKVYALITQVTPQHEAAAATQLNTLQKVMVPADFQLCTAKIAYAAPRAPHEYAREQDAHQFGSVRFSNIVFNADETQALLSYDWYCGPKCGLGELLVVHKVAGRWRIKHAEMLWIS